jgi:hypothetical protein
VKQGDETKGIDTMTALTSRSNGHHLCFLSSGSGSILRPDIDCSKKIPVFFLVSPENTKRVIRTYVVAARSGRCVEMVPHNAHAGATAAGRRLLLHCLGTLWPSIAQLAFREQIMTSTDNTPAASQN